MVLWLRNAETELCVSLSSTRFGCEGYKLASIDIVLWYARIANELEGPISDSIHHSLT